MMTETLEERKKMALEDLRVATAHCIEFESAKEDLVSWYEEHQKLIRELLAPCVEVGDGELDEAIKRAELYLGHYTMCGTNPLKDALRTLIRAAQQPRQEWIPSALEWKMLHEIKCKVSDLQSQPACKILASDIELWMYRNKPKEI